MNKEKVAKYRLKHDLFSSCINILILSIGFFNIAPKYVILLNLISVGKRISMDMSQISDRF